MRFGEGGYTTIATNICTVERKSFEEIGQCSTVVQAVDRDVVVGCTNTTVSIASCERATLLHLLVIIICCRCDI